MADKGPHPEKQNAKPNVGLPKKIPVNAGTAGSVPTPANLGVPTPPAPFDAAAAMGGGPASIGVPPADERPSGGAPFDPEAAAASVAPGIAEREPFPAPEDALKMVQGIIFHWDKADLKNLVTYAAHLLTMKEKKAGKGEKSPAIPPTPAPMPGKKP